MSLLAPSMNPHATSPAAGRGLKRNHDDSSDLPYLKPATSEPTSNSSAHSSSSSFRNVSACNRCRLRKNRCDQKLPACAACEKANVKCVGYDPITKREIPRSYVYYLESRTSYLEQLLKESGVQFIAAESFALDQGPTPERHGPDDHQTQGGATPDGRPPPSLRSDFSREHDEDRNIKSERDKLDKLVSNIGMVSVQGASDPRYLGSTSGISFARVVFAAVKNSVSAANPSERGRNKSITGFFSNTGTSMRDSIFGLQNKPTIQEAAFPDRELGLRLVNLYFEHANPQIPILHRGDFMSLFDRVYSVGENRRSSRESYMLNIVFAIGAAIIYGTPEKKGTNLDPYDELSMKYEPPSKMAKLSSPQYQPEEYHASAIVHLESFLGSSPLGDRPDGFGGGLEELQAVLLLASFALLRPVAPGLWYIVGVAGRLGIDLGLHHEQGIEIHDTRDRRNSILSESGTVDDKEKGRREWVRDLRRRLWWCVYSFDRLVSTCVGRPFGITDQVVTTEFPSLLDDRFITPQGFLTPPPGAETPTYKLVSHHYFRLRLLQSEIQQVLQYEQVQQSRAEGVNKNNQYMHTKLPSPFLQRFRSFQEWRADVDGRLWEWKTSAPDEVATAVRYSPMLMELNYWQAVIVLYRQSLTAPSILAEEVASARDDMSEPSTLKGGERGDEEIVFLKVAEAGQKVLKLYRQLHRVGLVNYTYLATHHLFMAGISFLYAIWHSTIVRSQITLDDVDFTVMAATSVLEDLIQKCPPAEACKDAFNRMARATIQMCLSTTGFGSQAAYGGARAAQMPINAAGGMQEQMNYNMMPDFASQTSGSPYGTPAPRAMPRFDMNLRDLFSEDEGQIPAQRRPSHGIGPVSLPNQFQATEMFQQSPTPSQVSSHAPHQGFNMGPPHMGIDPNLPPAPLANMQAPVFTNSQPFSNQPPQAQAMPSQFQAADQFNDLHLLDAFPAGSGDFVHHDRNLDFFGMGGLDGSHDWRDGTGVDMFDGFFFGAAGT